LRLERRRGRHGPEQARPNRSAGHGLARLAAARSLLPDGSESSGSAPAPWPRKVRRKAITLSRETGNWPCGQLAVRRVRGLSVSTNPDGKPLLIIPPKRALPHSHTILVNTHATPRTATFTPACARPHRNMCTLFAYPRQDPSFSGLVRAVGCRESAAGLA
jgi:hypothetical protein